MIGYNNAYSRNSLHPAQDNKAALFCFSEQIVMTGLENSMFPEKSFLNPL
jgi:hypothetical protein